jgi:hypothetical protein
MEFSNNSPLKGALGAATLKDEATSKSEEHEKTSHSMLADLGSGVK